jgi:hypothetical protein
MNKKGFERYTPVKFSPPQNLEKIFSRDARKIESESLFSS